MLAEGLTFRYKESPIHNRDPRVKLLLSLCLFAVALSSNTLLHVLLVFVVIMIPGLLAKILRRMLKTLTFSLTFSAFIFIVNFIVGYGLVHSATLALRFVTIVAAASLFFLTTSPDELEYVMRWMRLPRDFIFAFVTAVRFVPVLMLDLLQILDAQKSRGLEVEKGGPIKRLRNLTPVLVPLIVNALVRSGELAEAMEARGYGAVKTPTSLYTLSLDMRDVLFMLLTIAVTGILIYLSFII
jgi:energy-coupling factor transport system permease protein